MRHERQRVAVGADQKLSLSGLQQAQKMMTTETQMQEKMCMTIVIAQSTETPTQ